MPIQLPNQWYQCTKSICGLNKYPVMMLNCDFRAKSRGSKTPASAGRDRKGEKESEKDKGRIPVDSRRATSAGMSASKT